MSAEGGAAGGAGPAAVPGAETVAAPTPGGVAARRPDTAPASCPVGADTTAGGAAGSTEVGVRTPPPDPRAAESLQIAGLTPLSTVDWPGRLVATVFTQGCPWRCPYCHNHAILDPRLPGVVAWERVEDLMSRRRGLLDGIVFSGGEATRQLALADACRRVRAGGHLVGLHTAGPYPGRLAALLAEGLVDWVGLDVKALPGADYDGVAGRANAGEKAWESLRVLLDHGEVDHEVRLTVSPGLPSDPLAVARACREAGVRTFALQQARSEGAAPTFEATRCGWDEEVAALARECEALGFERFLFRPAADSSAAGR